MNKSEEQSEINFFIMFVIYAIQYKTKFRMKIKKNFYIINREQLEKQRAYANYQKLHAQGKTDEARADLARLAIIKQQREEAAKKREEEKKQKEMALQKKSDQMKKALGK